MPQKSTLIYKIMPENEWQSAISARVYHGSVADRRDGYIHFSAASQAEETANRHFAGQDGLVVAAFPADAFGADLRWEPSRGGELFPHLYRPLDPLLAVWARPIRSTPEGHFFPDGWRE